MMDFFTERTFLSILKWIFGGFIALLGIIYAMAKKMIYGEINLLKNDIMEMKVQMKILQNDIEEDMKKLEKELSSIKRHENRNHEHMIKLLQNLINEKGK